MTIDLRPTLWYLATAYTNYRAWLHIAFIDASRAAGELLERGIPVSPTWPDLVEEPAR